MSDSRLSGVWAKMKRPVAIVLNRLGDLFVEWVCTGNRALARSLARSLAIHSAIIALAFLPWVWGLFHPVTPYKLPSGGAQAAQAPVKHVNVRRKPRLIQNPHSDISFNFPEIQNIDLGLDKLTEHAFAGAVGAGVGTGAGHGYGGQGEGKIRFIRLQYDGGDWDQDYGLNADVNMLIEFSRRTGIAVADHTEHVKVLDLLKFPKDQSPPFLYITGEQNIILRDGEVKNLREYLLNRGGMLFADNGGGNFDSAFRNLMRRVVPECQFVEVPFDDEIFERPYALTGGAPPLWHHSGYRALGLHYQGRWIVFYHQGDMGDAWKTGHSGAPGDSWEAAYELGVNVIDYSVRNYLRLQQKK